MNSSRHSLFSPVKPLALLVALGFSLGSASERGGGRSATPATPSEKTESDTSGSAIVRIVDFVAHPILQVATWPVQNVLAPGVEVLTFPVQPPLRYFLEENVIERSTGLFQFGSTQNLSIYPTISLASGTSSRTGATLRHQSPFGRENDRLAAYFSYFVNGDYRMRTYLSSRDLGDTRFNGKLAFSLSRLEGSVLYQPEVNTPHVYAQNSESYEAELDHPIIGTFRLRGGFALSNNRFEAAPLAIGNQPGNALTGNFFQTDTGFDATGASRGLTQSFYDRIWKTGLVHDTRTNENIPLDGSRFELLWSYHDADLNHDFHEWRGRYTTYFKLGAERYELTAREEQQLGGVSVERFLKRLEYQRVRQTIFSRKVLVLHLYGGQSYEVAGNRMPIYGLQALGNATPLRAYSGSRYRDYAVAAGSMEYRFPLLRIMDGTIFNEYGVVGSSFTDFDFSDDLRNSWGFGVRVRRPDMFLFRIEMAFNGFSGMAINATADTPF